MYDAAGNLYYDGTHHFFYDAENRLAQVDGTFGTCSSATACYLYDGTGRRVEKQTSAATTDYLYDLGSHIVAEVEPVTGGVWNIWKEAHVYLNNRFVAQYANSTVYFVHEDHLGSTRLMTNLSGCVVDSLDYLPFGEQNSVGSTSCTAEDTIQKFTGKERDSESGLDNFGASSLW